MGGGRLNFLGVAVFTELVKACALAKSVCSFRFVGYYTREHDFGTCKVFCVSNVTFHAEFKYAIKIFPSPTVFVQ